MPALATGLPFYRKKQSLDSLANERPQNLQSVYKIVRENLAHVQEHVAMLEHAFYGPGGSLDTEVSGREKWVAGWLAVWLVPWHTPIVAFQRLSPNSARIVYASEGALFTSAQLSMRFTLHFSSWSSYAHGYAV